jgi:hypothetical protein
VKASGLCYSFLFVTVIPEQIPQEIVDELRWHKLSMRRFELAIAEAFEVFRACDIEPILIKGWAAARNYPEGRPRFFGDIDLAFSTSQFDRAVERLSGRSLPSVSIDPHREFRHLDTLPWDIAIRRSKVINVDGGSIRVLCPEDHLRVLCVHWLNDGGAYKERLWDIYYAVANRPPDFDWELCLKSVSETRRRWIVTAIAIARKYLSLDVTDLPFDVPTESIPNWIIRCLEKEWSTDVRLIPLEACLHDPKLLTQQILKRTPPNPIEATIEVEGELDDGWRIPYQIGSIRQRIGPSFRGVRTALLRKIRN